MSNSYFIGIVGGSGSGKTTFVQNLKKDLEDQSVCIISLDDYYKPREDQITDKNGVKNFDLPESIDAEALFNDVMRLIGGEKVEKKEYTFNNDLAEASNIIYEPSKIYIIEGLFIYHFEKIRELFDLKVFLEAKSNIKVIRRIKRDRIERNYDLEDVLYRYENHVLPSYEKYIEPYIPIADIVINNNSSFSEAYRVLISFIKSKL